MYDFLSMIEPGFKDTVRRTFGSSKAEKWFKELNHIMATCISKWNLTDCQLCKSLSMNLICFVQSPDFGRVTLKVGVPNDEMLTEINALAAYGGRYACKLHDSEQVLGAILEERLVPGVELWSVTDFNRRIDIAGSLMANLPLSIGSHGGFPTFGELLRRGFTRARAEGRVSPKILRFTEVAETLFDELNSENSPKVLLHGDLHHSNILQGADGYWKAIDPKGIIGLRSQETARFMENQVECAGNARAVEDLCHLTAAFATKTGESEDAIAKSAFIDNVLSICWTFEEERDLSEVIESGERDCQTFFDFARRFL